MAKSKYLKLKPAKDNPLTRKVLMGFLSIFFVITMILTIPAAVGKIAPALGWDTDKVLFWGKSLSSISGGMIILIVASSFAGAPIIGGALAIAGLIGIGWGVYNIWKEYGTDVGTIND